MVHFEDLTEDGKAYLRVSTSSTPQADDADHKFPVYPSMLRSSLDQDPESTRKRFPKEMSSRVGDNLIDAFVLKSCLTDEERFTGDERPLLLGRKIIAGSARWGGNSLKISGETRFIPLYWEWAEDILWRFSRVLKNAEIYDAVYASLYTYDKEPNIIRAFCESWCPWTNTLHTEAGEWSVSLWDLHILGGLSISGRPYDETVPSLKDMQQLEKNGVRRLSKACENLFAAHCLLADQLKKPEGVSAAQWIQFWCKREEVYKDLPKKKATRPVHYQTHNPTGEIDPKGRTLSWTQEESSVFSALGITDEEESESTYLAAFLSCWLCVFVVPTNEKRVIRPGTFEVATKMATGTIISLAPPVLASIYHGLNNMVKEKPASSSSVFPAHYLYGWLAHYLGTHYSLDSVPLGPWMTQYSGFWGARPHSPTAARELIFGGHSFRAASLVFTKKRCEPAYENGTLDVEKFSYVVSLRTAYLPLRSKMSFYLEPYHPTRFSRQFGFYQDVPRALGRVMDNGHVSLKGALDRLMMLLFRDSRTNVRLPWTLAKWKHSTTEEFERWWCKVKVADLRENITLLCSSVETKAPASEVRPKKRAAIHNAEDSCDVNFKRIREDKEKTSARSGQAKVLKPAQKPPSVQKSSPVVPLQKSALKNPSPVHSDRAHSDKADRIAALSSSSDRCSSTEFAQTLEESLLKDVETSVSVHTTSSSSLPQLKSVGLSNTAVEAMQRAWLLGLLKLPYDEVEDVASGAATVCKSTEAFGCDASAFQATVDKYVGLVRAFLKAQGGLVGDPDELSSTFFEAEQNAQRASTALETASQEFEHLKKELSLADDRRASLRKELEALDYEVASMAEKCKEQTGIISSIQAEVASTRQRLDDLIALKTRSDEVKKLRTKLDEMRKNMGGPV